jgi:hypothetical protein
VKAWVDGSDHPENMSLQEPELLLTGFGSERLSQDGHRLRTLFFFFGAMERASRALSAAATQSCRFVD